MNFFDLFKKPSYIATVALVTILVSNLALTLLSVEIPARFHTILLTIATALAGYLFYLQRTQQKDAHRISTLIKQLKQINQGNKDTLDLPCSSGELAELVAEIQQHLAMETERLLQEQNFSADTSHELRTPLAGMRLQAQVAQRTDNAEVREKSLSNIIAAVDRTTRLVEQLLTFSRLSRRRTIAENTIVDLVELFQSQILKFSSMARARQLQVHCRFPDAAPALVKLHRDQIIAALDNLIHNTLIHSPKGSNIVFSLQTSESAHRLTFEDSGPGLTEQEKQRVIVPFQKSASDKQKGSGLGLAIAHKVALLHDGELRLSHSELGGLKVQLSLPVSNSLS